VWVVCVCVCVGCVCVCVWCVCDVSHNLVLNFASDVTPELSRLTTRVKTVKVTRFVTSHSITMVERRKKNKSGDGLFVSDVNTRVLILPFFPWSSA